MAKIMVVSIRVPCESKDDAERTKAQNKVVLDLTARLQSVGAIVSKLAMPPLRSGYLDNLFLLLADIPKHEEPVQKLRSLLREKIREPGETVSDKVVLSHVIQFDWDFEEFPVKDWSDIESVPGKVDGKIQGLFAEYEEMRIRYDMVLNKVESLRSNSASLVGGDFALIVEPQQVTASPNLVTLMVPESCEFIARNEKHALYTVVLFGDAVESFTAKAGQKGFLAHRFALSPEEHKRKIQDMDAMLQEKGELESAMSKWCHGAVFKVERYHLHLVALRMHVDSMLTYGCDCCYVPIAISPPEKGEKVVRDILDKYVANSSKYILDPDEVKMLAGMELDDGSDHHVGYVSVMYEN